MSDIFDKIKIFDSINSEFKYIIKLFHLFNFGRSVVFITIDDKVFEYCGTRSSSCCYGHYLPVNKIQLLHELCDKKVQDFY